MVYTKMDLFPQFEHRYKFKASIYNIKQMCFEDIVVFLDTGCFNTMIPRSLAELAGIPLGFGHTYRIGGRNIEVEAFSVNEIRIKDFAMKRVLAFAGEYSGEYRNDIILGTNVMNNWEMIIDKESNLFKFREKPSKRLPNKDNIYQNYFDPSGNYQCPQDTGVEDW
jgi:hypothetical protein